jgi:hypothetical protein
MKLCTMPYSGAVSVFLRALVNKKYTLPYVAVDALAAHFVRFHDSHEPAMPVIWHQALLAVAQRYKADLTREQKAALHALAGKYAHHVLSAEIRRELGSAGCRGEAVSMPVGAAAAAAAGGGVASAAPAHASASAPAPARHIGPHHSSVPAPTRALKGGEMEY